MYFKGRYCFLLFLFSASIVSAHNLTLKQAEQISLKRSSEIKSLSAQSQQLYQSSIAKGQLEDPKLSFAIANLPTNSFSFSAEPMTQIQIGIEQIIPKGSSLKYQSLSLQQNSQAIFNNKITQKLQILQKVRQAWLNLSYFENVRTILYKELRVFRELVNVTQSMLANNKTQQKDVVRAQLELLEISNKLINIKQNIAVARSQLERWLGSGNIKKVRPLHMPYWRLKSSSLIYKSLKNHPILKSDQKLINAKQSQIKLAKEQFKPGFVIGGGYGLRQGNNINGSKRTDFLQLKLGVSLPIFPSNRQLRQLKAKQLNLIKQQQLRLSHLRDLKEIFNKNISILKSQQASANLYESSLLLEAKQYAHATRLSYENVQTDFPTLAQAYIRQFKTNLGFLTAQKNRTAARINLLFIQGI